MKFNKMILGLLVLASSPSFAAIEHETCEIVANWQVLISQVSSDPIFTDWSKDGTIEGKFESWGYFSKPALADLKQLPDGALFTRVVTSKGAKRTYSGIAWFAYTIIQVNQRDSKAPNGFKLLATHSSNPNASYLVGDSNKSVYRSFDEALSGLQRCRVKRRQ